MSPAGSAMRYRRLRTPRDHGGRLIDPPLSNVRSDLAANRRSARSRVSDLNGRSIESLAGKARSEVLAAAVRYTSRYRTVSEGLSASAPIVMTGHQPELFHAGVWFKNFVLDRITREQHAVGINLLIDNDMIRQPVIRVPTGSLDEPLAASIAFDQPQAEMPFEERRLVDQELFSSFSRRVRAKLFTQIDRPLVDQLWPEAVAASRSNRNLGACLAQARHQLEAVWGCKTLELPWSHVCDGEPFRYFVASILAQLSQFQEIYNGALLEYRRVNRVRSQSHPVPMLTADREWIEAPFWFWSSADPTRRRLFARQVRDGIEITDRQSERHHLSIAPNGSYEVAAEQLRQLSDQGIKVRSRALLTTMFARLFLCDLFLHGIGGAKYDQLTDAIIQRFYGFAAPSFVTVTATAKLPIEYRTVSDEEILAMQLKLRELRFNPQRYLASNPSAASLIEAKRRLIASQPRPEERRERYRQITQLNGAMQPLVEGRRVKLLQERSDLIDQRRIDKLLGSREYAFCLFPEATLRPLLLDI